jgi:hypothetical protein
MSVLCLELFGVSSNPSPARELTTAQRVMAASVTGRAECKGGRLLDCAYEAKLNYKILGGVQVHGNSGGASNGSDFRGTFFPQFFFRANDFSKELYQMIFFVGNFL